MWLSDSLAEGFPERVIPPLPDKNRLDFLGRFTPDFIKKRQAGLKRFLYRLDRHPVVGQSDLFIGFLEQPVVGMSDTSGFDQLYSFDALPGTSHPDDTEQEKGKISSYLAPLLDSLGDVLSATFLRSPQSVDETFLNLRKNVHIARAHLSQLERLFSHRTSTLQPTIIEGMSEISSGFEELSAAIDINLNSSTENSDSVPLGLVKAMLSRVSATMTQCKTILIKSMEGQESQMHAILAEMVQYCDAALELILLRDRRQVEQEELEALLQKYQKQRDEIRGFTEESNEKGKEVNAAIEANVLNEANDQKYSEITAEKETIEVSNNEQSSNPTISTQPTSSFMSYLTAKWDAWKGIDPITAKQNRLIQLSQQISQVSEALKTSKELLTRANSTLQEEIYIFEGILRAELESELKAYREGQIHYHQSNLVYWKDFLSWLDNPPKHLH